MVTRDVELREARSLIREICESMAWSQRELSRRSGVPQTAISRLMRGRLEAIDLDQLSRLASAAGARVRIVMDAPFLGDRLHQRDQVHARCIGYVAIRLRSAGWQVATEVEIPGRFGPGWIDILAYHPGTGRLLVIEIKTEIEDLGRIQRTLGWYEHEAWAASRRLGWIPRTASGALFVLSTRANDDRLRANRALVRLVFPLAARRVRDQLAAPTREPLGRSLAMIDPLSRARAWLRTTVLDDPRMAARYANYAEVAGRLASPRRS